MHVKKSWHGSAVARASRRSNTIIGWESRHQQTKSKFFQTSAAPESYRQRYLCSYLLLCLDAHLLEGAGGG